MFTSIAEQNFLLSHIDENKTVLEYGSGASTNRTQTRIVRSSDMTPIDNGLNSPWKVDVELLEKNILELCR